MVRLIVYGDFNCPYSRLASLRVDRLLERGTAEVEWRAVQHDREMSSDGVRVDAELRAKLERMVTEIEGLLRPAEHVRFVIPEVRPNTAEDCRRFASLRGEAADDFRQQRFEEIWGGQPSVEADVDQERRAADVWQEEWEGIEDKMVPLLVSPGALSRGVDGLVRLGELLDG